MGSAPSDHFSNSLLVFANVNFLPGKYDAWQAAFDDLAVYVKADEPTTKTYYFGIPFDYAHNYSDTNLMFAFEIYADNSALNDIHLTSPAMQKFLPHVLPTMSTGLDLMHYSPAGGFLDAPGDLSECEIMTDTRIWCVDAVSRSSVVAKLDNVAGKAASGVYTFLVAASLDDETEVRILSRFRDRMAMEEQERAMVGFWQGSKGEVRRMESRGYLPNGKGWLHR
ncbi:hypothetical protein BT63DRAFT_461110 [Microthyrium microscopicum]|uniref:ABM domain-containing protein n=1 Tax=Microthyrium microscopicum TaxID=703497 RepID=A0A6A6TYC2_9PEZI|nr:hypothetical protein BT63DRAFT_461110 [Microthyrium microscopicum]